MIIVNGININEIPEREGCHTHIHLCCNCEYKETCEAEKYREQGWCHTFEDKNEIE